VYPHWNESDIMSHRIRLGVVALVAIAIGACSSDSTAPLSTGSEAARAADQFAKLADSVTRAGGDADVGGAYSAIAGAVRAGGRVSPIVLTIDGVATTFTATAITNELAYGPPCVGNVCAARPKPTVLRSLIAWDAANPRRVVQLTSQSDDEPIAAMLYPSLLAIYAPMASLVYMDGSGGTYFGTSGTQKFAETNTTTPCVSRGDSVPVPSKLPATCTQSNFDITFTTKAEPSIFLVANNTAKGVHAISMTSQAVAGSHLLVTLPTCDTVCYPGPNEPTTPAGPPVVVRPSAQLPATLTTTFDSLVTMTLTVKNPSAQPVKVTFPGQRYDFIVTDSTTGRDAWRWAADKVFNMALADQIIPANGSLEFTERWKPLARGRYLIHGLLVSTTHRAEAYASVVVP
jgi:hypothetical protein